MAINPKKNIMPTQDPIERACNFKEVALGYDKETAILEASRCLNCPTRPCVSGCPVHIEIPDFIKEVKNGDFEKAYDIISKSSSLPAVCGRVCPQESQCESKCTLGNKFESVAIGRIERFVADYHNYYSTKKPAKPEPNGHKVAIIGSGPSGLACASDLAKAGFDVTIFEALHVPGGVLVYGIPEFRLPKSIVEKEINGLKELGVKILTNVVVGHSITVDELAEEFEYIYIGTGAGLPKFMNIPGEGLNGVFSANEYLTRINLMKAYLNKSDTPIFKTKKVVVVGGGNVAMDAARCAKRMGNNVVVVYRRTENEMPARKEEIEHAKEEGIEFNFLTNPVEIVGNNENYCVGIKCIKMELGEPDASGRRRPVVKPDSEHLIECDGVIMALGTSPNPLIKNTTEGLNTESWGGIIADENGLTSKENIYAGGDAVTGAATVILAMGAGKKAAKAIIEKVNNK